MTGLYFVVVQKNNHVGETNDEPDMLEVGKAYEIEKVEPHTWHTKLKLVDIDGKFNSVCFTPLNEDWSI